MQVKGIVTTPRIDRVLTQFRQQIASEAVTDPAAQPVTQPASQSSQPVGAAEADPTDPINEERIRKLEHQVSQLIQQVHIYAAESHSLRSIHVNLC